jgi:hypothetical protein
LHDDLPLTWTPRLWLGKHGAYLIAANGQTSPGQAATARARTWPVRCGVTA